MKWQVVARRDPGFNQPDRIVSTLGYLIARARFHNQRQAARIQAKLSPRNGKSKPVSSVQPKHKKAP